MAVIQFIGGSQLAVEHSLDDVYSRLINVRGDRELLQLSAAGGERAFIRRDAIAYVIESAPDETAG